MDSEQLLNDLMGNLNDEERYIKPVVIISIYLSLLYILSTLIITNNYYVLIFINILIGELIEDLFAIKPFSFSFYICWIYIAIVNYILLQY
jgi:hypothetical protein